MSDIPKPTGDVLRRNAEHECGTPIGQIAIKIHGVASFQNVSFYCNQPRLHLGECCFLGKDVIIRRRS